MDTLPWRQGSEEPSPARPYTRELRIPRNATVVAQGLATVERSWIRVELIDSSDHGLGLRSLIPFPRGMHLALSIIAAGAAPELLHCSVQHCTKLKSGHYDLGLKILERIPGNLNTTRIPETWRTGASPRADF